MLGLQTLLLALLSIPGPSCAFHTKHAFSNRRQKLHVKLRVARSPQHVDHSSSSSSSSSSQPAFLVLFKGGAAGREDSGHSLSGFRQSEFRAVASMEGAMGGPAVEGGTITFRDALITNLAEAAGISSSSPSSSSSSSSSPTAKRQQQSEQEDDEDEDGGGDASSLQYIEGGGLTPDCLRHIVKRLVLTHSVYELWSMGSTWNSCAKEASRLRDDDPRIEPLIQGNLSWSGSWNIFGSKRGRRRSLTDLPSKLSHFRQLLLRLPGPVNLRDPNASLVIVQDGDEAEGEKLHQVFLLRELGRGPRGLVRSLSLKTRRYVSTTSMDARTSLVMANMAQVGPGDRVLDPYCGSGGLLLGAARFGAGVTVGVDVNSSIDMSKVASNFHQQSLQPPTSYIFGDVAQAEVQARLYEHGPYDAILSDPPYGKREKGSKQAEGAAYEAAWTLVGMAANNDLLKVGGRLVFFLPCHPRVLSVAELLPSHACLRIVDTSCQCLNANLNRWLITMHKHRLSVEGEAVVEATAIGDSGESDGDEDVRIWHYTGRKTTTG